MHPSSLLVGATSARSSASSSNSCPSRARNTTIRVTADFGSFPAPPFAFRELRRPLALPLPDRFALRVAIVAGIVAHYCLSATRQPRRLGCHAPPGLLRFLPPRAQAVEI